MVVRDPLRNAYFGDLHVHTAYSLDAFLNGNRIPPADAYRFARGERIELPSGIEEQLDQPLDFVAITDHAEGFDVIAACTDAGDPLYEVETCEDVRNPAGLSYLHAMFARMLERPARRDPSLCEDREECERAALGPWQELQRLAEEFNDPGRFTTFVAYEFSPLLPDYGMLHRNVIFRGTEVGERAISSMDVRDTAEFFGKLAASCTGACNVLTIPHNMNFSWGLMFSRSDENGDAYTEVDLARRVQFDRAVEIFQSKGASECAVGVGTTDEECDFEQIFSVCESDQTTRCARPGSFAREALKDGLIQDAEEGTNPFKVGIIASTDTHSSDPGNTAPDARYRQAVGSREAVAQVMARTHPVIGPMRVTSPGGLAGVWAESNTREDLFDALYRREVFGTSGTRIRVRFFGGYDLPIDLLRRGNPVDLADRFGVPMGGDLEADPHGRAPRFWVWATQDPGGATLDRIEVVKGSYDGNIHERVWDVVCSGNREPDSTRRCEPTPAAVDPISCEVADGSGETELVALFEDPEFDPSAKAFFYVKVYENPTCRWTTLLARSAGLGPPTDQPITVQERAWSSPIWYSPAGRSGRGSAFDSHTPTDGRSNPSR